MAKHELATSVVVRHGQQDNHDDNDTGRSPVNTDFVEQIEIVGPEDVDRHAYEHDCPETEDCLPCIGGPAISPETDCR